MMREMMREKVYKMQSARDVTPLFGVTMSRRAAPHMSPGLGDTDASLAAASPTTSDSAEPLVEGPSGVAQSRRAKLPRHTLPAALLLCATALLRPVQLGGDMGVTIVAGTSMQPGMHTGDLVITWTKDNYEKDDIAVYRVPEGDPGEGGMVVHRIIEADTGSGYTLLGDNRDTPDIWHPHDGDIIGSRVVLVPKAGHLATRVRGPIGLGLLGGGTTMSIFLTLSKNKPDATECKSHAV